MDLKESLKQLLPSLAVKWSFQREKVITLKMHPLGLVLRLQIWNKKLVLQTGGKMFKQSGYLEMGVLVVKATHFGMGNVVFGAAASVTRACSRQRLDGWMDRVMQAQAPGLKNTLSAKNRCYSKDPNQTRVTPKQQLKCGLISNKFQNSNALLHP